MWKNMVETEGSQMKPQHDAYAFNAEYARLNALMSMNMATHMGAHTHARTHANACKRAHTQANT